MSGFGPACRRQRQRPAYRDRGSSLVEFVLLSAVLVVPVAYLVIVAATVQRAAFAVTSAVREAGRAYVTASSDRDGHERAVTAARLTLADAHVPFDATGLSITCAPVSCGQFVPGTAVTVRIGVAMPLPGLPRAVCGSGGCPVAIPVSARHTEQVECFVATGGGGTEPACVTR